MSSCRNALAVALIAALAAFPAQAVPGGKIDTLPLGKYECELPGDAAGPARIPVPEEDFTVVSASSYRVKGVRGTYLLTGDRIIMTSGPFYGKRFHRASSGVLHRTEKGGGDDSNLRCVLAVYNRS